jgi:hypothetical protein
VHSHFTTLFTTIYLLQVLQEISQRSGATTCPLFLSSSSSISREASDGVGLCSFVRATHAVEARMASACVSRVYEFVRGAVGPCLIGLFCHH